MLLKLKDKDNVKKSVEYNGKGLPKVILFGHQIYIQEHNMKNLYHEIDNVLNITQIRYG